MMRRGLLALLAALALAGNAPADTFSLTDPNTGVKAGWTVTGDESVTDVRVLEVDAGASRVRIEVDKDFGPHRINAGRIEYPDALLVFLVDYGAGVTPVSTVIVERERIANHTGLPWDHFDWHVQTTAAAAFDVPASAGWHAAPLPTLTWQDGDAATANHLTASGGTVADGATFAPAGGLTIDIAGGATTFTLKQLVAPEPGSLALLAAAGTGLLIRRRRKIFAN